MFWVVDQTLKHEPGGLKLNQILAARSVPHAVVRKKPFADYLIDMTDTAIAEPNRVELDITGPVFVTSLGSMDELSARMGWNPGYIDAPGVDEGLAHWGAHMLNADMQTAEIGTLVPPEGSFFIRPVADGKSFAGTVMNSESFEEWRAQLMSITGWTTLPPETLVAVAPIKRIVAEYRCLCVHGRIITASRYKHGSRVFSVTGAPTEVLAFVADRLAEWMPRPAVAIDVAETDQGLRIVETNSVSSAGFYAMDMELYVEAINTLA